MKHSETFNFTTKDSDGNIPDLNLIDSNWTHTGNGKMYQLFDFAWDGETDKWKIAMFCTEEEESPMVVRPLEHLFGNRDNGERRYTRVEE